MFVFPANLDKKRIKLKATSKTRNTFFYQLFINQYLTLSVFHFFSLYLSCCHLLNIHKNLSQSVIILPVSNSNRVWKRNFPNMRISSIIHHQFWIRQRKKSNFHRFFCSWSSLFYSNDISLCPFPNCTVILIAILHVYSICVCVCFFSKYLCLQPDCMSVYLIILKCLCIWFVIYFLTLIKCCSIVL